MLVRLPRVYATDSKVDGNVIRQLAAPERTCQGELPTYRNDRIRGHLLTEDGNRESTLVVPRGRVRPDGYRRVLQANVEATGEVIDLSGGSWLRHDMQAPCASTAEHARRVDSVLTSWQGCFSFVESQENPRVLGLRAPQLGAVHAVTAHWTVSRECATVMLPTGVGKTDTMIAIHVSTGCGRVLVVVPTDALRAQLTEKFLTLGILRAPSAKLVAPAALYPVVCTLTRIPRSVDAVRALTPCANVIVTTSHILGGCSPEVLDALAAGCDALFIDEAHHAEARTWADLRDRFSGKRVVQFTATPFRDDLPGFFGPSVTWGWPLPGLVVTTSS